MTINGGSLWHDLYFIRQQMLPIFIPRETAKKILVIGKSINFLRACIHSGAWEKDSYRKNHKVTNKSLHGVLHRTSSNSGLNNEEVQRGDLNHSSEEANVLNDSEMRQVESTLRTLRYGDENKLEEVVSELAAKIDVRLLNVMLDKAQLVTHLHALKKFMLLGQVLH